MARANRTASRPDTRNLMEMIAFAKRAGRFTYER